MVSHGILRVQKSMKLERENGIEKVINDSEFNLS